VLEITEFESPIISIAKVVPLLATKALGVEKV
jgi:hypothetical protein